MAVHFEPCVSTEERVTTFQRSISVSLRRSPDKISVVSSVPVAVSCHATGLSLIGRILISTVSELEVNTPSETWNVKLSDPLKLSHGVYVNPPVELRVSIHCVTSLARIYVSGVPSTSVPRALPPRIVSSLVVKDPERATGGVLVLVILRITVPVFEIFPSISDIA